MMHRIRRATMHEWNIAWFNFLIRFIITKDLYLHLSSQLKVPFTDLNHVDFTFQEPPFKNSLNESGITPG